MPCFDHFGILAPFYERVIRPPTMRTLLDLSALRPDLDLLDVGGGTGRVARHFCGQVRHVRVLDVSAGMLRETRGRSCLLGIRGVSEALPFADGAFPRIIAVDSLHHFADQRRAVGELLRVLTPGGRLIIEEPDIRRWVVKLVALGEKLLLMRSHFQRPERIAQWFETPMTRVQVHVDSSPNFWVVVDKLSG